MSFVRNDITVLYSFLTAVSLILFGFRGLTATGYYGGWTTLGILIALAFFKSGQEINQSYPIIIVVIPMTLLSHLRVAWLERLTGPAVGLLTDDEAYFNEASARIMAIVGDNTWVEQRLLRIGVLGQLEERDGKLAAINYSLYSPDRIRHHDFTRCFKIELSITVEDSLLPGWVSRRINRLTASLRRSRKAFFAGVVIDLKQQNVLVYIYYDPHEVIAIYRRLLHWATNTPGQPKFHSFRDPLWQTYYDVLQPDPNLQQHLINERFCQYHEQHHFDLTSETGLFFLLSFPDAEQLQKAQTELEAEHYERQAAPQEERGRYYLIMKRETRIGAERLNVLTDRLSEILTPLGGRLITCDLEDKFRKVYDLPEQSK